MMLKALIVEQLDVDGTLRTFEMQPSGHDRKLVVAFADEWDETPRSRGGSAMRTFLPPASTTGARANPRTARHVG
jgi:hypothetical protein